MKEQASFLVLTQYLKLLDQTRAAAAYSPQRCEAQVFFVFESVTTLPNPTLVFTVRIKYNRGDPGLRTSQLA